MLSFVLAPHTRAEHSQIVQPRYVYFLNCDSKLIKVDLEARKLISARLFSDQPGAAELIPTHRVDGCSASSPLYDPPTRSLFFVAPKEASVEESGTRHYRILAFNIPDMVLTKVIDIEPKLLYQPQLAFSPDRRNIRVTSGEVSLNFSTGFTYELGNRDTPPEPCNSGGDRFQLRELQHTPAWQALEKFAYYNPDSNEREVFADLIDCSGRYALFRIMTIKHPGTVVAVVDVPTQTAKVLSLLPLAGIANLRLTSDGKLVAIEEVEQVEGVIHARKTGRLFLHDVENDQVEHVWVTPAIAGTEAELLCVTGSKELLYAKGRKILVVTPMKRLPVAIDLGFRLDPGGHCLLTDR